MRDVGEQTLSGLLLLLSKRWLVGCVVRKNRGGIHHDGGKLPNAACQMCWRTNQELEAQAGR